MDAASSGLSLHVGIIMDGNGRWAQNKGLPRTAGHKEGLEAAKRIVRAAADLGIRYVTLYTFSTENWKRTQEEVGYLMGLIKGHLRAEFAFYKENQIKVGYIGDLEGLPKDVQAEIINVQKDTAHFTGTTVVLAINYGSRDEITRAVNKMLSEKITHIDEKNFSRYMDIPSLPDVDLLIRTGGEERLSNFLLWQTAYAEFVFSKTLWPDYNADEFKKDIMEFEGRNRRFGGVKDGEAKAQKGAAK